MGTLTRSQLVTEITKNLGGRTDTGRIIIHLNLAQDRINRRRVWPELNVVDQVVITPTGVADTDRYHDLTSGGTIEVMHLYGLARILSGEYPLELIQVPSGQWLSFVGNSAEHDSRDPTHYNKWRPGYVEFYPVPVRTFTLIRLYRKKPTKFTAVADVASDFEDKDDILINYATSSLFGSLGMLEDEGRSFTKAESLMRDALTAAMAQPAQTIIGRGTSVGRSGIASYVNDPFMKKAP